MNAGASPPAPQSGPPHPLRECTTGYSLSRDGRTGAPDRRASAEERRPLGSRVTNSPAREERGLWQSEKRGPRNSETRSPVESDSPGLWSFHPFPRLSSARTAARKSWVSTTLYRSNTARVRCPLMSIRDADPARPGDEAPLEVVEPVPERMVRELAVRRWKAKRACTKRPVPRSGAGRPGRGRKRIVRPAGVDEGHTRATAGDRTGRPLASSDPRVTAETQRASRGHVSELWQVEVPE